MEKKYYTTTDIRAYALRNKATYTHASLAFITLTFTNRLGRSCKVAFDRVDALVWKKKNIR